MFSKMMCSCVFLANVASHATCGAPSNAGFPWYGGANDFESVRHTWCNSFIRDAMDDIRKVMDGVNDKFTEQQNGMKKQLIDVLSELLSKRVQDARQVLIDNINTQMGLLEKETKEELDKKISDLFQEFRSHSTSEIAGSNSRNDSRKVICICGNADYRLNNDSALRDTLYMYKELGYLNGITKETPIDVQGTYMKGEGADVHVTIGSVKIKLEIRTARLKEKVLEQITKSLKKYIDNYIIGDKKVVLNPHVKKKIKTIIEESMKRNE